MQPQQGLVRIKNMTGKWQLTPVENNKVKVVYEMNIDPGGKIPKWLVNAMLVDIPFNTLQKLRSIVKEAKYVNANLNYIIE
jgi:ribosome-associated toxin RatA of RatAB toxin-antitoxin module